MDGRVWREKGEEQIMRLYYNLKNKIHIFKKQNEKLSAFLNESWHKGHWLFHIWKSPGR